MKAPKAKKIEHLHKMHGDTRVDNYYWLNQREDQEVIDYLTDENAYTKQVMADTEPLQKLLFEEMKGRIKEDDQSVPYQYDGYWFYTRYETGKEYPVICRKKGNLDAVEEILIDQNELAKGQDFHALGGLSISTNKNLLAYSEDLLSRRIYTIKVKNLSTGELLSDQIENTTGSIVWANDNETLYYTQKDESLRAYKIYRHTLGTPQSEDICVYHEEDNTFNCSIYKTKSKQYLIIGSYSTLTSDAYLLDADNPNGEFKQFIPREREHEYSITHFKDHFYILTNWDAKNFRLMKTPLDAWGKDHWEEVIAHRPAVMLEDIELFNKYMVLGERSQGLTHLRIMSWDGQTDYYLPFQDPAYVAYTSTNLDIDTEILRYGYTSLTTPNSVFDFNMRTQEQVLLKQQPVLGDFNPDYYQSERVMVTVADGTQVPVSLVYKKELKKDGPQPLLLYGYGSYGHSIDPTFSSIRLSLLDRGFIYAIAHIRGGEEMGRAWYEDGKLLTKMNTFTDFIDCGKYLIEENYTSADHLYGMGGSAGGLLIGAVINIEPSIWNGAIAAVPFVDVVTTMLDETIPLTTGEYDEWGNPNNKEYYDYMKSYSPYDNVVAQKYPNLLVTTGLHDSQVQYWEPAKWVALLRETKTDDNILLLETDMKAGHGGASGRFERLKEIALEYAFLLKLENIDQ